MCLIVGVVIGFERSSYYVAEDVGSVTVCATVQTSVGMEHRALSVEMRTVGSGKVLNTIIYYFACLHYRSKF